MKYTYLFLFIAAAFIACKKEPKEIVFVKNPYEKYTDFYNYYPMQNGRQWFFNVTEYDSSSKIENNYPLHGVYSADSNALNLYLGSNLYSMFYWSNSRNTLGCCGDRILINYDSVDCVNDSALIYSITNTSYTQKTYQYKGYQYCKYTPNYSSTNCIKTIMMTTYSNGDQTVYERYYGYKIGFICERELHYSEHKLLYYTITALNTHQF